jgi:hypothetical protein
MQAYAWTKLLLDRYLENGDFNDEVLEKVTGSGILRLPDGKEAIDTVTDVLSLIYAHKWKGKTKTYQTLSYLYVGLQVFTETYNIDSAQSTLIFPALPIPHFDGMSSPIEAPTFPGTAV